MPCASHRDANRTTNREWQAMQRQETQSNGEVLVIFRRGTSTDLFTQLTNQPTMTAAMSPRIAVLANAAAAEQLRHHPQVEAVIMRPEDEIPNSLNHCSYRRGRRINVHPTKSDPAKASPGTRLAFCHLMHRKNDDSGLHVNIGIGQETLWLAI
jgi:hypothetical protein